MISHLDCVIGFKTMLLNQHLEKGYICIGINDGELFLYDHHLTMTDIVKASESVKKNQIIESDDFFIDDFDHELLNQADVLVYDLHDVEQIYQEGGRFFVDCGLIEEFEVSLRSFLLFSNDKNSFVGTFQSGEVRLLSHQEMLDLTLYNKINCIERCWGFDYNFSHQDLIRKL